MITLVIASANTHKVQEIRGILSDRFQYRTLKDSPAAPVLVENTRTFAGNATAKAAQLARWLSASHDSIAGLSLGEESFVLADDSGLEVDALDGAPGVYSARFAGLDSGRAGNSPDAENNAKLLRLLEKVPDQKRTARFRCVLALTPLLPTASETASPACAADEFELHTELFEGACEGRIATAQSGNGGFGYDPLFIPSGQDKSFAELGETTKNQISHRAKALSLLRKRLELIAKV